MQRNVFKSRPALALLPVTVALLVLSACGGGYSDTPAPPTRPAPMSLLAGSTDGLGNQDGAAAVARFSKDIKGLAVSPSGDVVIADAGNNAIRKISTTGQVSTVAGGGVTNISIYATPVVNYADGTGTAAQFGAPEAVAVDSAGNTYVADTKNHVVRKIDAAGKATTLAGQPGKCGNADGSAPAATFCNPSSIAVDGAGTVYVAEMGSANGRISQVLGNPIRKISATGEVTTVVFKASQMPSRQHFSGGAYVYFYIPVRLAVDAGGTLYVADPNDHVVRKFEPNGQVTVLAGTVSENNAGYMDGAGTAAKFHSLDAIALDRQNQAYVLDGDGVNKRIRRVGSDGTVSTIVQSPRCSMFETLGQSPCSATHLAVDAAGGLLVNEFGSMDGSAYVTYSLVRRFTADGLASSVAAGSLSGFGALDGTGGAARFALPTGLAFGKGGTLYAADSLNHTLRTISAEGVTRTLGMPTQSCYRAEPGRVTETSFCYVTTLALDGAENLYVPTGNRIMKVTPAGDVSLLIDLTAWVYSPGGAGYDQVQGIALDSAGNVYVAMETSGVIFKISPTGQPVVFAGSLHVRGHADGQGSAARFSALGNMTTDASGNFYVVDGKDYPSQGIGPTVRKITPEGVVSTIAGKADAAPGWVDGARDVARFRVADEPLISSLQSAQLAVDGSGNVYITDPITSVIRKIAAADGQVSTLVGQPGRYGFTAGPLPGMVNRPVGIAVRNSTLYISIPNAVVQVHLP